MKKTILIFFCGLFLASSLRGANFHEHLISLPFPEHFRVASSAIFALPANDQEFSKSFESEEELASYLRTSTAWDQDSIEDFLSLYGNSATIRDFCSFMEGEPSDNLVSLLSFSVSANASLTVRQQAYISIENMRKQILLSLSGSEFLRIFEAYFKEDSLANRRVISATITRRFFEDDQEGKYWRLRALAQQYGSKLVYRVSLQRNRLLKSGILLSDKTKNLIEEGEIGGVDIVGSLREREYTYPFNVEDMEYHLRSILDYMAEQQSVLVFHLFEGVNSDKFYDILEKVLLNYDKEVLLEVGHIAYLDKHWLDVFAANPRLRVIFHLNLASNRELKAIATEELKKKVLMIQAAGFNVVSGSDGRGVLKGSSYAEQQALIETPLAKDSFLSQHKHALLNIKQSVLAIN
ncbi:MAG: hypothetical protein ACQEP8_03945 [Chlamydiota bacterium]